MSSHIIRIFLSSPGDVAQERNIATEIVSEVQNDAAFYPRIKLELVAWEQPNAPPLLANLTPQEAINRGMPKPSECDVVVVIFGSRMGTPLPPEYRKPDGTLYLSGTEWEYWDAFWSAQITGKPELILYRCTTAPSINLNDPTSVEKLAQYERVKEFFAAFNDPATGAASGGYNSYTNPQEFKDLFKGHLRNVLIRVAQVTIQRQIRRLLLRYHNDPVILRQQKILQELVAVGAPAQSALLDLWHEMLRFHRAGAGTPHKASLDTVLLCYFPDVFKHVLEELVADAKNEDIIKIAAELFRVEDRRILLQLVDLIQSPNERIREIAIIVLGHHKYHEIVPTLLYSLENDPNPNIRSRCIQALGNIGDPNAVPALLAALQREDKTFYDRIARALGQLGDPQAIPALIRLVDLQNSNAIRALGYIGDLGALGVLMDRLQNNYHDDQKAYLAEDMIDSIGQISHAEAAIPLLADIIRDKELNTYNLSRLQRSAAEALAQMGSMEAIVALGQAITNQQMDSQIRFDCINALSKINDQRIIPVLADALRDPAKSIRIQAVKVLSELNNILVIPGLLQALDDPDQDVRNEVAIVLGCLGDTHALYVLTDLILHHDVDYSILADGDIRIRAVEALGHIDVPETVSTLSEALTCKNEAVGVKAAQILYSRGDVGKLRIIVNNLENLEPRVRVFAANILGEIGDPHASPALIEALYDSWEPLRIEASVALRKIGTPTALAALEQWRVDLGL